MADRGKEFTVTTETTIGDIVRKREESERTIKTTKRKTAAVAAVTGLLVGGGTGYGIARSTEPHQPQQKTKQEVLIDEQKLLINGELLQELRDPEKQKELKDQTVQQMKDRRLFELADMDFVVSPKGSPLNIRSERKIVNEQLDAPSNIIAQIPEGVFHLRKVPVLEGEQVKLSNKTSDQWYYIPDLGVFNQQLKGIAGNISTTAITLHHPGKSKMGSFAGFDHDGTLLVKIGENPNNTSVPAGTRA